MENILSIGKTGVKNNQFLLYYLTSNQNYVLFTSFVELKIYRSDFFTKRKIKVQTPGPVKRIN